MPRLKQPLYDESSWRMQVGFEQANPSIEMWIESSVNQGGEPKLHVYRDRTKTRGHASVVAHIDVDTCPDELRKPDGKFSTTKAHEMWRAHFRFRLQHYRIVGIRAEGLTSNDIQARGGEEYLERTITGIGMPANKSPHGQKTLNKKHDEGEDKEEEEMPIAASDGIVEAQKGSHSTLQASAIPKQKPSDHVPGKLVKALETWRLFIGKLDGQDLWAASATYGSLKKIHPYGGRDKDAPEVPLSRLADIELDAQLLSVDGTPEGWEDRFHDLWISAFKNRGPHWLYLVIDYKNFVYKRALFRPGGEKEFHYPMPRPEREPGSSMPFCVPGSNNNGPHWDEAKRRGCDVLTLVPEPEPEGTWWKNQLKEMGDEDDKIPLLPDPYDPTVRRVDQCYLTYRRGNQWVRIPHPKVRNIEDVIPPCE